MGKFQQSNPIKSADDQGNHQEMLPCALAAIALLMCVFPPWAAFGVCFGAASLITRYVKRKRGANLKAPKGTIIAATIAIIIGLGVNSAYVSESESESSSNPNNETAIEEAANDGILSFKVTCDGEETIATPIIVNISGETNDGTTIKDEIEAEPGRLYNLEYGPGTYIFTIDPETTLNGDPIVKEASESYEFSGKVDQTVEIRIERDAEAMEAATKAKEEAESAEKAGQETEAAQAIVAESPSSQSLSSDTNSGDVVVYKTNSGSKYHTAGCRYLKSKIETTVAAAQASGLQPCGVCHPPS